MPFFRQNMRNLGERNPPTEEKISRNSGSVVGNSIAVNLYEKLTSLTDLDDPTAYLTREKTLTYVRSIILDG